MADHGVQLGDDDRMSTLCLHGGGVRFHMRPGTASDGLPFKYTLTVEDVKTGALLLIDPMVVNERVG